MKRALLLLALIACGGGEARPRPAVRTIYVAATDDPAVVGRIAKIMQRRLDRMDVRGSARAEGDEIVVELPALDDVRMQRTHQVLARSGRLELHVVDSDPQAMEAIENWVHADPRGAADLGVVRDRWRELGGRLHLDLYLAGASPEIITAALAAAGQTLPDDRRLLFAEMKPGRWRSYLVVREAALSGDHVEAARVRGDEIEVELDRDGTRIFAELTQLHVGDKLAIVLDGRVSSAPVIMEPIRNGTLRVTVGGPAADAADLAIVLDTGALPAPVLEQSSEPLR